MDGLKRMIKVKNRDHLIDIAGKAIDYEQQQGCDGECEGCPYFIKTADDAYCSEPSFAERIVDLIIKEAK